MHPSRIVKPVWHTFMMTPRVLSTQTGKPGTSLATDYRSELLAFGLKNVFSCIFPAFIFGMLILSKLIHIPYIPRYDFLLLACIGMQAFMYFAKLETATEVLVITMFHL